jgi:hypothetical protein
VTQINRYQLKNSDITGASLTEGIGIYSEIKNYAVGDIVFWNSRHYKCVSAVTGTTEGDLSNAPHLSSDWAESYNSIFSCYPSSSQTFTNSRITINFNTERHSDADFSLSSGEITFNKSGTFIVCVDFAINNYNGGRSGANGYLQMDTGSGFTDLSDYKLSTYNRDDDTGENSGTLVIPLTVDDGDKIRLQAIRYDGSATLSTIPDGCSITIFDTRGERGPKGDDGAPGPTGAAGDLEWKGSWSSQSYDENDTVEYNGSCFVCTVTGTTSNPGTPSSPNAGWELVARAGTDGSGTSINVSDSGSSLANTPHSTLNFTGDISAVDGGSGTANINVTIPKNTYMLPVWAEENAALGAGNYEWAFGNGANTPNDGGLTVFVPSGYTCQVVAMSLRVGGGTATVELVLNGTLQGSNCDVTVSSGQSATNSSFTPITVSNNNYINFRTTTENNNSGPNVVTAWLKYTEN